MDGGQQNLFGTSSGLVDYLNVNIFFVESFFLEYLIVIYCCYYFKVIIYYRMGFLYKF